MKYNPEQESAIFGKEPLIVVAAGAGSGKTKVLSERYVHLCEIKLNVELGIIDKENAAADVSSIVTLTFTEDAALEMKDRIRKRLIEKRRHANREYPNHTNVAIEYWKNQIEALDNAVISTFHSFCQRIVLENSFEANIYPDATVMDDTQSKLLKAEIFSELVEEGEISGQWSLLLSAITSYSLQESLFAVYGKVKEYEINTSLVEKLNVDALLTDWKLSKSEKLNQLDVDFYSFFQADPDTSKLTPANKKIYDNMHDIYHRNLHDEQLLMALQGKIDIKKNVPKNLQTQSISMFNVLNTLIAVRDMFNEPEENQERLEQILLEFESFFISFDGKYEEKKRELALLDFSDLQQKALSLLNDPDTQGYYSSLYKHFLIDEFQDTNQLQLRMIEKINPPYRFIVGDGKQSIYRFRGADVQLLNSEAKKAREDSTYSYIDMNINYRTCHSIIEFINLLFEEEHLMGTSLETGAPMYKTEYSRLNAFRNDERCSQSRVEYIKVSEAQEVSVDENQYHMIARRMVQLLKSKTEIFDKDEGCWRPVEWSDMSVLMASRTNLTRLELALKELDIPYNVYGGLGFYDRQEVIDFLSLLRWLNRPFEPLYIMAVLRSPMFGLTMDEFLEIHHQHGVKWSLHEFLYEKYFSGRLSAELNEKLERFCALYESWTPFRWSASIQFDLLNLLEESGLINVLLLQKNNLMKIKNIEKLIEIIVDLHAKSMEEMLTKIAILADLSEKEGDAEVELTGGNFVHIMTIHGSKGLEYPVVFVPNLSRALPADRGTFRFDIERGISVKFELEDEENLLGEKIKIAAPNFSDLLAEARNQAVEESKRLFYVALTRARDLLILTSKDKEQKESWFSWLELALANNEKIKDYITVIDELPKEKAIVEEAGEYAGPSEKIDRAIPIAFSVSEVMSYMNVPEQFLEKHILRLDEAWLEDAEEDEDIPIDSIDEKLNEENIEVVVMNEVKPTILGTIVHRICELLDRGYEEKDAYREALSKHIPKEEEALYLKQVTPVIKTFQSIDLGEPVENEWDFILELNGVEIIGEIDKVIKNNGVFEVIDLKTNRIHDNVEELVQYYKPQLYLYKMAYEKANGVKIESMKLVFLRDQGQAVYEVNYESDYELRLLTAITEVTELKRKFMK